MRLIHTQNFEVRNFDTDIPPYAILSHTWGENEVTLQDLWPSIRPEIKSWKGFEKVKRSCATAFGQNHDWIWIDTCCIDKTSSSELSEAINSMFRWYKESAVCFAFLSDVHSFTIPKTKSRDSDFHKSRWFTRGWTLQELVCPREIKFYNSKWYFIGTRSQLQGPICDITRIPMAAMHSSSGLFSFSVAQKMSWAARRQTTRGEDMAYCLLGLFDINMPLLYGEGEAKAFIRLQQEILSATDDESILAWSSQTGGKWRSHHCGLLAWKPSFFSQGGDVRRPRYGIARQGMPTSLTNRGIRIDFELVPLPQDRSGTIYVALLNCMQGSNRLGIVLQLLSPADTQYARILPDVLATVTLSTLYIPRDAFRVDGDTPSGKVFIRQPESHPIYVRQNPQISPGMAGFVFSTEVNGDFDVYVTDVTEDWETWNWMGSKPFKRGEFDKACHLLMDFDTAHDEHTKNDLDVERICTPIPLGAIRFDIHRSGDKTVIKKFDLVVGLEPPPSNPFGTVPGYAMPWYSLDNTHQHELEPLRSVLDHRRNHSEARNTAPSLGNGFKETCRVIFSLEDKFSRIFCQAQVVIDPGTSEEQDKTRIPQAGNLGYLAAHREKTLNHVQDHMMPAFTATTE